MIEEMVCTFGGIIFERGDTMLNDFEREQKEKIVLNSLFFCSYL